MSTWTSSGTWIFTQAGDSCATSSKNHMNSSLGVWWVFFNSLRKERTLSSSDKLAFPGKHDLPLLPPFIYILSPNIQFQPFISNLKKKPLDMMKRTWVGPWFSQVASKLIKINIPMAFSSSQRFQPLHNLPQSWNWSDREHFVSKLCIVPFQSLLNSNTFLKFKDFNCCILSR